MKKFLCLQRSVPRAEGAGEKPSPAQMQEKYAQFLAWKEKYEKNIVDMGGKLNDGKLVTYDGVMDGPFVESKELIGGYMIIAANSWEEAIEVARESPGVHLLSNVEVREIHQP